MKALIYGVFDPDPSYQVLTINGRINLADNKIINETGPSNARDPATKGYVNASINQLVRVVKDYDRNIYLMVKIGPQTWMTSNLKTTHLNDSIPLYEKWDNSIWSSLTTPGYCWYNNDDITYSPSGAL